MKYFKIFLPDEEEIVVDFTGGDLPYPSPIYVDWCNRLFSEMVSVRSYHPISDGLVDTEELSEKVILKQNQGRQSHIWLEDVSDIGYDAEANKGLSI